MPVLRSPSGSQRNLRASPLMLGLRAYPRPPACVLRLGRRPGALRLGRRPGALRLATAMGPACFGSPTARADLRASLLQPGSARPARQPFAAWLGQTSAPAVRKQAWPPHPFICLAVSVPTAGG
jgi:hypothetical protein